MATTALTNHEGKATLVIQFDNETEMQSLRMLCRANDDDGYKDVLSSTYFLWKYRDPLATPSALQNVFDSVRRTLDNEKD